MTDIESARHTVRELLRQQRLGVLSTVGDSGPYNSLVAFVASTDNRHLYFVTPRATRKFINLSTDVRVALLVSNSTNQPEDFQQAAALTAMGIAKPLPPTALDAARNQYMAKHPSLGSFARSPDCELVDIRVTRYILVEQFKNVIEYGINHDMDENT